MKVSLMLVVGAFLTANAAFAEDNPAPNLIFKCKNSTEQYTIEVPSQIEILDEGQQSIHYRSGDGAEPNNSPLLTAVTRNVGSNDLTTKAPVEYIAKKSEVSLYILATKGYCAIKTNLKKKSRKNFKAAVECEFESPRDLECSYQ